MENFEQIRQERGEKATKAQCQAANPLQSVWVEASAGTGKTKVLSDRVLRLLLDDVSPMRILCLTYTKAAAVEMNSRISERLSEWAVIDNNELIENLHKLLGSDIKNEKDEEKYSQKARTLFAELLDTPGGIKIQTIHSFCTDVLKCFPLEAGVSPYFTVLEEQEAAEALSHIKSEILLKENYTDNQELKAAIKFFTENMKESTFPEMLKEITEHCREMVKIIERYKNFSGFINALSQNLGISADDTEEKIKSLYMNELKHREPEIKANILAWMHGTDKTDKPKAKICEKVIADNFPTTDYDIYKSCFLTADNEPRTEKSLVTKGAKDADQELLSRLFAEQEKLQICENKLKKLRLYQSTRAAFTIVSEINERYEQYKRLKSCMDFTDLIYKTRELLQNSSARQWVLYKLDGGVDHILLDEAQDTSPEQWDIVAALCDDFFSGESAKTQNRTIFVVGDRKQSIFSFQGADPDKFDAMSKMFEQKAKMANKEFKRINLDVSFRSAPAILEVVNKIFATKNAANGVVMHGEKLEHLPIRAGEFGRVSIWPLISAETTKTTETYENWEPAMERINKTAVDTQMAQAIAKRIRQMTDESANTLNPLHYRDFMVLVRTRNNFVTEFIRACKQEHINISGADKMLLSGEIAVQDLISLGKFLLYPQDSLSLAEVLTSPLFSVDTELLEDLCYNRAQNESLWDRVKTSKNEYCRHIFNSLKTLLNNLDYVRPYELFNFVLSQMDGRRKFIARMGQEVEDPLDEFINLTLAYEQRQIPSLRGFITWFAQSEKEIKRENDDQETDAVRLLTVHHSKGLQAPIVFLPDTSKFPSERKKQQLLFTDDIAYFPLNAASYDDVCDKINEKKHLKEMEEYRRLLYVALTRAEDQLFICAYGADNADAWHALCSQALAKNKSEETAEIIYETPQYIAKKEKKKSIITQNEYEMVDWIDENITPKVDNLAKPYTPSKDDEAEIPDSISPLQNNGLYFQRGILIHRLLQFLPSNLSDTSKVIEEYLQKNAADFSKEDRAQIQKEVLTLLNNRDFAEIFGSNSRAEVPVVGEVDGKIISAQIDRLIVLPQKIVIVDFKTNRPPAKDIGHTPKQYINQLAAYAKLIAKIYPDKPIETYILWTNETRLMRIA